MGAATINHLSNLHLQPFNVVDENPFYKPLKSMWFMVDKNNEVQVTSMEYKKSSCLDRATAESGMDRKELKEYGWSCEQLDISFSPTLKRR